MKPQAPLCLLLLAAAASAAPGEDPRRILPQEEEPSLEHACHGDAVIITLLPDAQAPDAQTPQSPEPRPSLEDEAAGTARLLGGKVKDKPLEDGTRELKWTRGDVPPEHCVQLLTELGGYMPGRVRVTDPRYGKTRALVLTGSKRAGEEVARVQEALPLREVAARPGFFEKFFDGGTAPLAVPEVGASGNPYEGMVFSMAPVDAPRPRAPAWRDGTSFPTSFNPNSAPPPNPAGSASSGGWLYGTGRSVARTVDRGVGAAADFAGSSWKTATEYWGRGAAWVKEKLLHAPLAAYTRVSSEFGSRFHPTKKQMRHHDGVDYAAKAGTAVFSAGDGVVESAGWKGGYGKAVVIRHASGTQTLYGHLSTVGVVSGQKVTMGRVIGQVGSTGQSTGPHLHYEVRRNGAAVDPLKVASL